MHSKYFRYSVYTYIYIHTYIHTYIHILSCKYSLQEQSLMNLWPVLRHHVPTASDGQVVKVVLISSNKREKKSTRITSERTYRHINNTQKDKHTW